MANNTPTFQGDEFSNNLFSDLGPLLALFGERVATQYLRHNTNKLESLIFACAPLGILTAVTSAIRVGGDRRLKAMIGRAEEPDALAEIELISSTSADVCELWNGVGLVRLVGKPHILELVIDEDLLQGSNNQSGCGSGANTISSLRHIYTRKEGMKPLAADVESTEGQSIVESIAPNISLNTIGGFASRWEIYAVAVTGVTLQLAVLAWGAVVTYHLRLDKGGRAIAIYAFPLTCIGTLGLVLGMYLCAYIIEVSTKELRWVPGGPAAQQEKPGQKMYRILWVQKGQTVGDQGFGSYAISSGNHALVTSHRKPGKALHGLTVTATAVSVGGFILQFVGLRAMHFSASIAQLVATIIMTVLRVMIRRHISQEPEKRTHIRENTYDVQTAPADPESPSGSEPTPAPGPTLQAETQQDSLRYAVQELTDGHEFDIIAMQLQKCEFWQVVTFKGLEQDTGLSQDIPAGMLAENVLQTRIRLTELLQSQWRTKIGEQAKVLSEIMARVMNSLWNSDGVSGSMPKLRPDSARIEKLSWEIPIETQSTDGTIYSSESIQLSLKREQLEEGRWGLWEAEVARIEAVLQLWMLQLGTYTKGDANVLWLLCPDDDYAAIMIAGWWIGREAGTVSDKTLEDICKEHRLSPFVEGHEGSSAGTDIKECVIGCIGLRPNTSLPSPMPRPAVNKGSQITRGVIQRMELGTFATQYILYTFLSHLVQSIENVTTPSVVRDEQATGPLLRNDTITDLALKVQQHGLCTLTEAYRILLCALAGDGKLPIPYQQSADIESFLVLYQKTLELGHKYKSEGDEGSPAALRAEKINEDALRLCRMKALDLTDHRRWTDAGKLVVRAAKISEGIFTEGGELMRQVRDLMLQVGSKFVSQAPPPSEGLTAAVCAYTRDNTPAPSVMPLPTSIHEPGSTSSKLVTAVRLKDATETQQLLEVGNDNERDPPMDKARALDYAAQRGNEEILILLHLYGTLASHAHAPLWWAVNGVRTHNQGSSGRDSAGIEADCVEVLKLLLDFGHNPNKLEPEEKESPLHLAAKLNLINAMEALLEKREAPPTRIPVSLDLKDQHGLSPLYYAAKEGHSAMTKLLLDHGANAKYETGPEKKSPMHYAAIHGDLAMLKILHEKGGDIEAFDVEGKNPLYYAAKGGSKELLEALLEMGAELDRKCPQLQGGKTALHWIAQEGNAIAIRTLLDKDAGLANDGDEDGKTALHHAVREGQKAAVYILLEKGAAIDKNDTAGKTPLVYAKNLPQDDVAKDIIWMLDHANDMKLENKNQTALSRAASRGDVPTVETLLRCGADVEAKQADVAQSDGLWTPLHHAAQKGHERIVQMLLDNGAVVDPQNHELWTPLHYAAEKGHERIVQILLDNGAVVGTPNYVLCTPLHSAALGGHERVVEILLDNGAVVGPQDDTLWTPLHYAAQDGYVGIIRTLLHRGADIEAKEAQGYTPLHAAALGQRPQAIQILTDNGADLHATDNDGNTPESYATQPFDDTALNPEVAEMFRNFRDRKAGTITTNESNSAQSAVTRIDSVIEEVELAEGVDTGLPVEQLVQQAGARQYENITEVESDDNESDSEGSVPDDDEQ